MNERPMFFGPRGHLFGVVTLPDSTIDRAAAVVFVSAGLLHRVGPNRLYVDLARRLADRGYTSIRFDLSGVGDSELGEAGPLYIERSRQDVIDTMDSIQGMFGIDRFFLVGLCTGAFNSFRVAGIDERVSGAVLLDGYAYPTVRSRIRHYRGRVLEPQRWARYLRRRLGRGMASEGDDLADDLVIFENEVVPKQRFADELAALVDRNVPVLMVYTGLGPLAFNYERQMHDAFRDIDLDRAVSVRYFPDADHTFTLPGNRRLLVEAIERWLELRQRPDHSVDQDAV